MRESVNIYGGIIGANRGGKFALTSHSGISVTHRIQINEQNKSIAIGPIYKGGKFEAM